MKRVPSYWWDFEGDDEIIVESDIQKMPVVGRFKYDPKGGVEAAGEIRRFLKSQKMGTKVGQAEKAIEQAEKLIADLNVGRTIPTKC